MLFSLSGAALLFWCFVSSSCAPVQNACADAQSSSTQLLKIIRTISTQNGSRDEVDLVSPIDRVEAKDMCDPTSLNKKSVSCMEKIHRVLGSYRARVAWFPRFNICSEFISKLTPALKKLHQDMSSCLRSRGWTEPSEGSGTGKGTESPKDWEADVLCPYTMDRLYSFSILTARVFAMGDPAGHEAGSAQSTASCASV